MARASHASELLVGVLVHPFWTVQGCLTMHSVPFDSGDDSLACSLHFAVDSSLLAGRVDDAGSCKSACLSPDARVLGVRRTSS